MFVIVYGGLADGIEGVVGPFKTEEAAEAYTESHNLGHPDSKVIYEVDDAKRQNDWDAEPLTGQRRYVVVEGGLYAGIARVSGPILGKFDCEGFHEMEQPR